MADQFSFGWEVNDTDLIFLGYKAPDETREPVTLLRVIEMKAAAHEGWLTYNIYIEREREGLPIEARNLFSVYSPLEFFPLTPTIFSVPIYNRRGYLDNRQLALNYCQEELEQSVKGSFLFRQISQALELIRLQLYGFGRAALQKGKIREAILAFKIAGLLNKQKIQDHLKRYQNFTKDKETVFESA